jgi:NO-binding membrane sensor protein with MHYT domain
MAHWIRSFIAAFRLASRATRCRRWIAFWGDAAHFPFPLLLVHGGADEINRVGGSWDFAARHPGDCARRVNVGALWAAAIALGGGGIWFMHFIGMSAYGTPPRLPVVYDLLVTALSMVAAIVVAAAAFYFVGRDPRRLGRILVAGVFAGSGVAIMHYTGMGAMRMQAIIEWNFEVVALSVLIAIVAAIAALWLTFNTQRLWQRIAAALVMGVAVCGMHYTGTYAGTLICVAEAPSTSLLTLGGRYFALEIVLIGATLLGVVNILYITRLREAPASS